MAEYIDREALKNDIATSTEPFNTGSVFRTIDRQPTADVIPRPHWIPADEELPPEGIYVLCWYEYFRYGGYNRMYQTFGVGYRFCGHWGGEVAQGRNAKVLAWMPLPEPPEMDGGADNAAD